MYSEVFSALCFARNGDIIFGNDENISIFSVNGTFLHTFTHGLKKIGQLAGRFCKKNSFELC